MKKVHAPRLLRQFPGHVEWIQIIGVRGTLCQFKAFIKQQNINLTLRQIQTAFAVLKNDLF